MKMAAYMSELGDLFDEAEKHKQLGQKRDAEVAYTNFISRCEELVSRDITARNKSYCNEKLARAYNSRGHLRYLLVEFKSATDDHTMAIGLDDSLASAYYNRGLIHYRMGHFDEAIMDMSEALQRDPNIALRPSVEQCLSNATISKQQIGGKLLKETSHATTTSPSTSSTAAGHGSNTPEK